VRHVSRAIGRESNCNVLKNAESRVSEIQRIRRTTTHFKRITKRISGRSSFFLRMRIMSGCPGGQSGHYLPTHILAEVNNPLWENPLAVM
jgi:hypothetical protein